MSRRLIRTRGAVLAVLVGLVAGGGACVESDDAGPAGPSDDAPDHLVAERDDQLLPTKCYDFTRGQGGADTWNLGDEQIDKWVICYTPRKGTLSYGDGEKCDTLEVTITIRGYKKTGEKDGKPVYTLYFTNAGGSIITMPMCKDELDWKTIVKILTTLNKVGIKWTEMRVGAPGDPGRVTYKPGDPGADDYMKALIKEILRNVRVGKPTKTWERKPKDKEVPEKMSFNDFNRLDTWPVGVTEIEVTGDDIWLCADTAEVPPTGNAFAGTITEPAPCLPPADAEVGIDELGPGVVDTLGAEYLEVGELALDIDGELEEADADGRLSQLYALLVAIDPGEFTDDDNADDGDLDPATPADPTTLETHTHTGLE